MSNDLARLAWEGDAAPAERLRALRAAVLPRAARASPESALEAAAQALGQPSWARLKCAIEATPLATEERAGRLKRALYFGHLWAAETLLALDPALATADLGLRAALYDVAAVRAALAADPAAATRPIDRRTPLTHLAFSRWIQAGPERAANSVAVAEALVAAGADVNEAFRPDPAADHGLSALYGALCHATNPRLADWLLARGADPNDNESLYHATELGHRDGLRALLARGARPRGTNALPRALDFDDAEAVQLLLEHGADPNAATARAAADGAADTIPALHQAGRRRCGRPAAEALLERGADPNALWAGRTAYARARICGAQGVVAAIEARGGAAALDPLEAVLAGCADGRPPPSPVDVGSLPEEDQRLLARLVWSGAPLAHLDALIAAGFDPQSPDEAEMTPLHLAAWEGLSEQVAFFLRFSPDLARRNAYGGDALDTLLHGAEFCPAAAQRDHLDCARLLFDAGARPSETSTDGCGVEALIAYVDARIEAGAPSASGTGGA